MAKPFFRSPWTTFSVRESSEPQESRALSALWLLRKIELYLSAISSKSSPDRPGYGRSEIGGRSVNGST